MSNLNLEQILDLFENGERRYAEDPAFKAAVDSLKMGLGVYAVLDHVLRDSAILKDRYDARYEMFKTLAEENQKLEHENQQLSQDKQELKQSISELNDIILSWEDRYERENPNC